MNWIGITIIVTVLILCFLTIYIFNNILKIKKLELKDTEVIASKKQVLPIILQANERITLMLERITPQSLIFRINNPALSFTELHGLMLDNIRQEFEHNMSQQIYLPDLTWKHVVLAKEEIVATINSVARNMDKNTPANVFLTAIFDKINETGLPNTNLAKQMIKKDVKALYKKQPQSKA